MKRPRHAMPDDVSRTLKAVGARAAYAKRPAYQRNDYIGWIEKAKMPETRVSRINQMVSELKRNDVYMKMPWKPSRSKK